MKSRLLILLTVFYFSISAQISEADLKVFPTYERVVVHFFSNHKFNKYFSEYYFSFEKTPDGWFISSVSKTNAASILRTPLWDFKTKTFTKSDGSVRTSISTLQKYINQATNNYTIFPFFGYTNFEDDVIKHFENQNQLSDSMLLALGLANSNKADHLCRNTESAFLPRSFKVRGLESAQTNMQAHVDQAITHYKNLILQNNKFVFRNRMIVDHLALEEMKFVMLFNSIKNSSMANIYQQGIQFTAGVDQYAKNLLMNCDSNSILFTNNEMDTYPLWFLQQQKFREDVWVINLPLLQKEWYRSYLSEELQSDVFGLPIEVINNKRLAITKMQRGKYFKSTTELFDILQSKPDSSLMWYDEGVQIQFVKTQKVNYSPGNTGYEIVFKTNNFLEIGPLAMMGIIHSFGAKKIIAFTDGYGMSQYGIGEKFLTKKGMIYPINYVHSDFTGSYPLEVDIDGTMNYMKKTKWNPSEFQMVPKSAILFSYTGMYTRLIDAFIKRDAKDVAKTVLDDLEQTVDILKIPAHFNSFYLISLYAKLGEENRAKAFTTHTVEDYLKQYNAGTADEKLLISNQVNSIKSILKYDSSFLMQELNRTFHFL